MTFFAVSILSLCAKSCSRCTKVHSSFCIGLGAAFLIEPQGWRWPQIGAAQVQIGLTMERYSSLLSESLFHLWSSQCRERNLSLDSLRFFSICILHMNFTSRWTLTFVALRVGNHFPLIYHVHHLRRNIIYYHQCYSLIISKLTNTLHQRLSMGCFFS